MKSGERIHRVRTLYVVKNEISMSRKYNRRKRNINLMSHLKILHPTQSALRWMCKEFRNFYVPHERKFLCLQWYVEIVRGYIEEVVLEEIKNVVPGVHRWILHCPRKLKEFWVMLWWNASFLVARVLLLWNLSQDTCLVDIFGIITITSMLRIHR